MQVQSKRGKEEGRADPLTWEKKRKRKLRPKRQRVHGQAAEAPGQHEAVRLRFERKTGERKDAQRPPIEAHLKMARRTHADAK